MIPAMAVLTIVRRWLRTRMVALVSALCIAATVAAMVLVTSVMGGFRERIHQHIRCLEPDLCFRWRGDVPRDHFARVSAELKGEMSNAGGPLVALSPRVETVGVILAEHRQTWRMEGVRITGVDFAKERAVTDLDAALLTAEPTETGEDLLGGRAVPGLLVGRPLLRSLSLPLQGSSATLMTGRLVGTGAEARFEPSNQIFDLTGLVDSGRDELDARRVVVSRGALQRLRFGPEGGRTDANSVHARVTDPWRKDVSSVATALRRDHPNLEVTTWEDRNRSLVDALAVERQVMGIVLGFIVFFSVALLCGLLLMMVVEKTRDIGVLRSMGLSRTRVLALFALYGLVLGAIGSVLGCFLGVQVVQHLNEITGWLDSVGIGLFDSSVPYRTREIPAVLDTGRVVLIGGFTLLLSVAAAALAAWQAARQDPLKALSYE
ncbi:MAG: ABC transporter permease [Planctomycetes bacterium]|nr:ABC transporter permease [Planctomycetota bacterium]